MIVLCTFLQVEIVRIDLCTCPISKPMELSGNMYASAYLLFWTFLSFCSPYLCMWFCFPHGASYGPITNTYNGLFLHLYLKQKGGLFILHWQVERWLEHQTGRLRSCTCLCELSGNYWCCKAQYPIFVYKILSHGSRCPADNWCEDLFSFSFIFPSISDVYG